LNSKKNLLQIIIIITTYCLTGCTSIYLDSSDSKDNLQEVYFGVVRVITPEAEEKSITNLEIKSIGAWILIDGRPVNDSLWGTGLGLGYKDTSRINISPKCQLVIIIKNKNELQELMEVLTRNGFKGENVCVTQKSP
jgi:hypothetical protein